MPDYAPVPEEIRECLELIVASGEGAFLPNFYGSTLDGSDVAEYLTELGYEVLSYEDKWRYGLVKLANGVDVSTSGYARLRR